MLRGEDLIVTGYTNNEVSNVVRVLFICTGNTCRSPMTEAMLRQMIQQNNKENEIITISAGLAVWGDAPASKQAVEVMRRRGIDLSAHRSRALTPELVQAADLILTMTQAHKLSVLVMVPEAEEKVYAISEFTGGECRDIADPFGAAEEIYQQCADEIHQHLTRMWQKIREFRKENAGENSFT